jgi:hypothetical protein
MLLMRGKMLFFMILLIGTLFASACTPQSSNRIESAQQEEGVKSLVVNQPVPDLGGYSFERDIVIKTFLARNETIATWAYTMTLDGKFIELCPSIGYPIPYATQLTAPERLASIYYNDSSVIPQPEPNGLYTPADAAATLIQCVNPDGTVSPMYFEYYVIAMPYRIKADIIMERYDNAPSSFSVDIK